MLVYAAAMSVGPSTSRRWLLLGAAAVCLGYLALEWRLTGSVLGFPLDDSWIHLTFARSLAAGEGLAYSGGRLVSGSTAPLWTAALSLLIALPGPVAVWLKLAGVALYLAGGDATFRLARQLGLAAGQSTLAAGLALATGWLVWSALSGLEIPLFVLLSLWGVILHLRELRRPERPPLSLVVLAMGALARPEGLLLVALAAGERLVLGRRSVAARRGLLLGLALAACLLVPVALFNLATGGSLLPTTFGAKAAGARSWLPSLRGLYTALGIFFRVQPWLVLLAAGGALELMRRAGGERRGGLLPALWLFGLPLAYAAISPPGDLVAGNFGRYFFPLFPFLAVLGVVALAPLGERLAATAGAGGRRRVLVALLVAVLAAPSARSLIETAGRYAQSVDNVASSDVRMARWLAGRLPAEAVLAVNDIGALGYFLPNRLVDLAGIANPELAGYIAEAPGRAEGIRRFLAERRPDYLVVFPSWFPELLAPGGGFEPVHAVEIPNNITMGGDVLAVYSTPWTRYPLRGQQR